MMCEHCGKTCDDGKHWQLFADVSTADHIFGATMKMTLCDKCRREVMDMLSKFKTLEVKPGV